MNHILQAHGPSKEVFTVACRTYLNNVPTGNVRRPSAIGPITFTEFGLASRAVYDKHNPNLTYPAQFPSDP